MAVKSDSNPCLLTSEYVFSHNVFLGSSDTGENVFPDVIIQYSIALVRCNGGWARLHGYTDTIGRANDRAESNVQIYIHAILIIQMHQ